MEEGFPAPSYRGNQRRALREIREAFEAGNEVVLVRAPTGTGKSLLARAICGCARTAEEAAPGEATGAYYTTPQVSQLDDVAEEPMLSDLQIVRGKRNYACILPGEEGTRVDRAPCVRERGYDCSVKHRCPYFSDRAIASSRRIAAMTLAYFMHTAGSEAFGKRDVVVVDEAHGLAEWAEMYATIELGPRTVPMWDDLRVPAVEGLDHLARYAESLSAICERRKDDLLAREELTAEEAEERDRLGELIGDLSWFVEDYRAPDSPTTWIFDQGEDRAITIKPLNPERYLKHTVWERGNRFALLSATILDGRAFCRGVGLDPELVALVDVPHTFPVEHRPLFDVACGKMTYEHREETVPKLARTIARVMAEHDDEKGLVHAHSYAIQERLDALLSDFGLGDRVRSHDRDDRDAALEAWKANDRPEAFLAVKMEEALDLEGDLARWQVLCKAPYLNTSDSRVAHRLDRGEWAWYRRAALRTVIQACGRVVRSPDDRGATYLADTSLLELFDRTRSDTPGWFREAVDRMREPNLPSFEEATAGSASPDDRTAAPADPPTGGTGRDDRTQTGSSTRGRSHPLRDVWGGD